MLSGMTDQRQQGKACFMEGGQAGKVQGNQIVRTLQSQTPHIDANCHGGRLVPRTDKEAVGACVFRLQVRSEWQVALSISKRNIWEMRWWECQPGWGDECGREMAAWGGNQKQNQASYLFVCFFNLRRHLSVWLGQWKFAGKEGNSWQ